MISELVAGWADYGQNVVFLILIHIFLIVVPLKILKNHHVQNARKVIGEFLLPTMAGCRPLRSWRRIATTAPYFFT